ncbi:MAG: hypothetical protein PF480_09280 [Roseovarius sp.]|jgi:hypothetical protein|nr:hypothetical protein [Roseovarius sp.]
MTKIAYGIIAGFVATLVMSALMMAKTMMGIMPELNPIHMMSEMMGGSVAMGWMGHFAIGIIAWGAGFAIANRLIPGKSQITKGILFGIAAWLMMMVAVMPMAGAGLFGLNIGMMAPVMTLMLHVIFGAVLGMVFASLSAREVQPQGGVSSA